MKATYKKGSTGKTDLELTYFFTLKNTTGGMEELHDESGMLPYNSQ